MVYCVGLTGGIASGKSTVADLFSQLGIEVIHADLISQELTKKTEPAYKTIIDHFGSHILNQDKELDRKKLRKIIFSNQEERIWLENLLHPFIQRELKKRASLATTPYCIVEIPLLITKKLYPYVNKVLLIHAPVEIQISRVMKRDQCSKEHALSILSAQPSMSLRLKDADDVINNNLSLEELRVTVKTLHCNYLMESKNQ